MSEDRWLAEALAGLGGEAGDGVVLGPGDDAAVLVPGTTGCVVTTDALVDGVHFDLASCGPQAAARKAIGVNLSDLAAMGARPRALVVSAVLPRPVERALFDGLVAGLREAAAAWDCPLVGGDTNSADGPLVLAVTALGDAPPAGAVTRSGGRAGDVLSVTGPLGGSLAGRHLTPTPRLDAGRVLAGGDGAAPIAHAMMDISDGLSRDLPRLARASGVGATLVAEQIPIHADAGGSLEAALHDGEDFELLVAHAPLDAEAEARLATVGVQLVAVGRLEDEAGVRIERGGRIEPLPARGFDHLAG